MSLRELATSTIRLIKRKVIMTKEKTPQTIESLKMDNLKITHRYQIALVAFSMLVLGVVGGWFLSINVVSDAQAKVVNSIEVTAQVKN